MSLHQIERFAFDRVFKPGAAKGFARQASAQMDAPLELAALKAEVQALREQQAGIAEIARIEGFEAGLAQAQGERETAVLSAIDALQGGLEALDGEFAAVERRLTGDATGLALAAADMLAGHAVEHTPTSTIEAALGRVLGQIARGTELQLRVHPDLVEAIERHIAARQAQDRRRLRITVIADDSLALGDGRIAWEQGGVLLDAAARRNQVEGELATLLGK